MTGIPAPADRMRASLCVSRSGSEGGYNAVFWELTGPAAADLVREFTGRLGDPDLETMTDEAGLLAVGEAHLEHAVVIRDTGNGGTP